MYRAAIVCEGPADRAILEAVLEHYFEDYEPLAIQPPTGLLGGDAGPFGGGWKGVRSWCESEVAARGGLDQVAILGNADLLVVQVDADVAAEDEIGRAQPCPPPAASADEVRALILDWLVVEALPDKVVLCVPCMASETWALAALWPSDRAVVPCDPPPEECEWLECRTDIKALLRELGKRLTPKLVVYQAGELMNQAKGYQTARVQEDMTKGWTNVLTTCSEACRFDTELRAATA